MEPEPQLAPPAFLEAPAEPGQVPARGQPVKREVVEEGEAPDIEPLHKSPPPAWAGKANRWLQDTVIDKLADIAAKIEGKDGQSLKALKEMLNNEEKLLSLCHGGIDKKGGKPQGKRGKSGTKGRKKSPKIHYCLSGIVNHFDKNTIIDAEDAEDVEKVRAMGAPIESDKTGTAPQKARHELDEFGKEFRQLYSKLRRGAGGRKPTRSAAVTKKALERAIAEAQIQYHENVVARE